MHISHAQRHHVNKNNFISRSRREKQILGFKLGKCFIWYLLHLHKVCICICPANKQSDGTVYQLWTDRWKSEPGLRQQVSQLRPRRRSPTSFIKQWKRKGWLRNSKNAHDQDHGPPELEYLRRGASFHRLKSTPGPVRQSPFSDMAWI